jgi:hypothetical protein
MEYIAFKALLRGDGDVLYSPQQLTAWYYDWGGHPCLLTEDMDRGWGIFAATWGEAAKYGDEIYMVVPYLLSGGDPVVALGSFGWRSSAATVIAGPWHRYDKDGIRQAAESILAYHQNGYRQVPGILVWAAGVVAAYDGNAIPVALSIMERALSDSDPGVRMYAVCTAGKIGAPALQLIERAMRDDFPGVRLYAALAAGETGAAALHVLEQLMRDSDTDVRREVARAAGKIGVPALSILESAIRDNDPAVRQEAARRRQDWRASALHPGACTCGQRPSCPGSCRARRRRDRHACAPAPGAGDARQRPIYPPVGPPIHRRAPGERATVTNPTASPGLTGGEGGSSWSTSRSRH